QISVTYEQIRSTRGQCAALGKKQRDQQAGYRPGHGTGIPLVETQPAWADALANDHRANPGFNEPLPAFAYVTRASQQALRRLPWRKPRLIRDLPATWNRIPAMPEAGYPGHPNLGVLLTAPVDLGSGELPLPPAPR